MSLKIEHIAIWAEDIELMAKFYVKYFGMTCGDKYHNPRKNFTSYFLSFGAERTRIELMHTNDTESPSNRGFMKGFAHIAVSVGTKEQVDALTETLRADGYAVLGEPRLTGDGYYESIIADPEGNRIEITQ